MVAAKPGDLSSILGTHMIGGENQLPQGVLWSPMCHGTHAHMRAHTHIYKHTDTPTRSEILKYRISFDQSAMKRNEGLKHSTHG